MATLRIIQNTDGTVTVRYGRVVAHVDVRGMTLYEAVDHVRWAAVGVGIAISEQAAWAALRADG